MGEGLSGTDRAKQGPYTRKNGGHVLQERSRASES